jgi:AraC-like DNA-binding protein
MAIRHGSQAESQAILVQALGQAADQSRLEGVVLASAAAASPKLGDPPPRSPPYPRLIAVLEGEQRFVISRQGLRTEERLRPGRALYLASHAANMPTGSASASYVCAVMHPRYLRVIIVEHRRDMRSWAGPTFAHHTSRPLGEIGGGIATALDAMAGRRFDLETARLLVAALARDVPAAGDDPGVSAWHQAVDFIQEHYHRQLTRAIVARAVHVHPNHLSHLFARQGKLSFRRTVERVRIGHARRLLAHENLVLARVAELCGFASAAYFIRAFKRATGTTPESYRRMATPRYEAADPVADPMDGRS